MIGKALSGWLFCMQTSAITECLFKLLPDRKLLVKKRFLFGEISETNVISAADETCPIISCHLFVSQFGM